MGLCVEEVPIFIDTNLETHLAMAVSPEITVGDLKREFGNEHSSCFPEIGQISIQGVMVKRKSYFYYLPDSMPIKNAFQRLKGAWFLHMNVTPVIRSDKCCPSEGLVAEQRDSAFCSSNVIDYQKPEDSTNSTAMNDANDKARPTKRKVSSSLDDVMEELLLPVNVPKKKKKKKVNSRFHEEVLDGGSNREVLFDTIKEVQRDSSQGRICQFNSSKNMDYKPELSSSHPNVNTPSPNTSELVSVTGILTRYFPEFDEVKSYAVSSSNKFIDHHENETLKSDAVENCSVILDQRLPINANKTPPPKLPYSVLPTNNTCARASSAKLGKSKTGKPKPSKVPSVALPDTLRPKTSKGCKLQRSKVRKHLPPKVPSIPSHTKPSPNTSRDRVGVSNEVGKRLIQAANDLGISTSKNKSTVSLCKSKGVKLSSTLVRKLDFDVSDSDD